MDRSKGTTVQARGFWGDIINSPYHAFCTRTDPEARSRLFKISSQQYRHTETDIAEYNLTAYISEMETGEKFSLPAEVPEEHVYPYASPLDTLRAVDKVVEVTEAASKGATHTQRQGRRAPKKVDWPSLSSAMEGVQVILLTGDAKEVVFETLKYQAHFDASIRVSFRHRVAQAAHLIGWKAQDEKRAVPRLESDMQERGYRELERQASDFLCFVTGPGASGPSEQRSALADLDG